MAHPIEGMCVLVDVLQFLSMNNFSSQVLLEYLSIVNEEGNNLYVIHVILLELHLLLIVGKELFDLGSQINML